MIRFIKWDYDAGLATEYERTGECNRCGECCKNEIHYRAAGRYTNTHGAGRMGNTTDGHGVWSEYSTGKMRRFIKLDFAIVGRPCSLLGENGVCSMHDSKSVAMRKQGALCLAWPIIPEHVVLCKGCSYTFREIAHWEIHHDPPV